MPAPQPRPLHQRRLSALRKAVQSGVADAILRGAGALLRARHASGDGQCAVDGDPTIRREVDEALAVVQAPGLRSWLERAPATWERLQGSFREAGEAAFEASFAESDEDRAELSQLALCGLAEREAVAGALSAIERRMSTLEDESLASSLADVRARIESLDAPLRRKLRPFTAINAQRRQALDELCTEARTDAWWFSELVDEADLVAALAISGPVGRTPDEAPGSIGGPEVEAARLPSLDPDADARIRADFGLVSEAEAAHHARVNDARAEEAARAAEELISTL